MGSAAAALLRFRGQQTDGSRSETRRNSVEPSSPRALHAQLWIRNINPYDVTADGQRSVAPAAVLNLIVNWPALLKKGSAAQ
jgi:hypothetical protein